MKTKMALVSDFDGTISSDDFFWYVTNKYLKPDDMQPWQNYIDGNLSHFDALNQIFAKLHISEAELLQFIQTIHFDKTFFDVAKLCEQNHIPLYICSAGCDYYIKELIGDEIKKYQITLITNSSSYDQKTGLKMIAPPKSSPYYDEKIGISKASIVKKLQNDGCFVVYAGDGPPDFAAAQIADVVFARKILLEKCLEAGIKTQKFDSFIDVFKYLEG